MIREQKSFCRLCLALCGTIVRVDGDRVVSIRGDGDDPLSHGYVCGKGRAVAEQHHVNRLQASYVRRPDGLRAVDIREAVDDLADAMRRILDEHGPSAIGTYSGGGAFADPLGGWASGALKAGLGVTQGYSTASVDMTSKTFVAIEMSGSFLLMPQADPATKLLLVIGSNPVVSHGHTSPFPDPVTRLRRIAAQGEVWVVDPRATETAALATRHLCIRPGSDHQLLGFLVRESLADPDLDLHALRTRANDIDALRAAVAGFDATSVAAATGIDRESLAELADAVRRAGRIAILTGTGTSMRRQAYLTEWLAWALLVVTDSFDRPGGMWFNPGFYERLDSLDRIPPTVLDAPRIPSLPESLPFFGEWPASLIPAEIEAGRLRALLVVGANPAVSLPHASRLEAALRRLDVLAVFDTSATATTAAATHVLACADQLERPDLPMVDLLVGGLASRWTDAVLSPRQQAPEMWRIMAMLGERLGTPLLRDGEDPLTMPTEEVMRRVHPTLDIQRLRDAGGCIVESTAPFNWVQDRLPNERWTLAPSALVAALQQEAEVPTLQLTPRRQTRRINGLTCRRGDEAAVLMHPSNVPEGVVDGDVVEVASRVGSLRLPVRMSESISAGVVSIPHGWADANVNTLVDSEDLDPITGMPVFSGTEVCVRRVAGS